MLKAHKRAAKAHEGKNSKPSHDEPVGSGSVVTEIGATVTLHAGKKEIEINLVDAPDTPRAVAVDGQAVTLTNFDSSTGAHGEAEVEDADCRIVFIVHAVGEARLLSYTIYSD